MLSIAAVSCGDDDTGDTGGSGGSSGAKAGGSGGKGGSGGTAGKGGAGGGGADSAKCVTDTTAILKDQPNALSGDCISCICKAKATAVTACNTAKNGACWQFIGCYAEKGCMPGANETMCVTSNCMDFLTDGLAGAQMVGPLIQMGDCQKTCAAETGDAGTKDAGN